MEEKKLTGRIAREKIKLMQVPRPPQGAVEAFLALGDPTGIVADAMDELGIPCGVVGASPRSAMASSPPISINQINIIVIVFWCGREDSGCGQTNY
jgi:hypothetical protein